jgi:MoxR-like ATPase
MAQQMTEAAQLLYERINRVVQGKPEVNRLILATVLAGGHVLIEDVPGVGKTRLALALAGALGGEFRRVQCCVDLMPSDLTGVNIYHPGEQRFQFVPGPVFSHVMLADELNRASPRTQAALLEAMEEHAVTVDGKRYALPEPFVVIATQNPAEQQGTFPLPEAQLDRFAVAVTLGYPDADTEHGLLTAAMRDVSGTDDGKIEQAAESLRTWQTLREKIRGVFVDDSLLRYMVAVVRDTREHPELALGVSPRGSLWWMKVSQALAFVSGRSFVTPSDVQASAVATLAHRVKPKKGASRRQEVCALIAAVLAQHALPD